MKDILTVELGGRSYPIILGRNLNDDFQRLLKEHELSHRKVAVICDESVFELHKVWIKDIFTDKPMLMLPSGETTKSLSYLEKIYDFLSEHKIDRTASIFAVGGGVIGDIVGFAAASYLRGIHFYQVPTTLLAMVDSSVGGKTGINLKSGKNLVGAFYQPQAVLVDMRFLDTLPSREFSAGMAEVLKYGLLGDAVLWQQLSSGKIVDSRSDDLPQIIKKCCAIKAKVVSEDEFERAIKDGRALLNLGHTFGHAVEKVAGYGSYLHGEAVGLGLVLAARLSQESGFLAEKDVAEIRRVVSSYGLPVMLRNPLSFHDLISAMGSDKKVRFGKLGFVVIHAIGEAHTQGDIDIGIIEQLWKEVGAE